MIRIEEADGLLCPVFVCAQCGQPIQGLGQGLIQWDARNDAPTFTVLHKGPGKTCSGQWEQEHGKDWFLWRPLETFADQLAYNTAHPFGEGESQP